jgi:dTDP-4-amino-4,6-dideoxygalactose transaminase
MLAPEAVPVFDVQLADEDLDAVAATLRSGWLTMGPRTQEFERDFAEHLGVPHAVAVSSCTAALHLAYLAAGVGAGDEVIVPGITFVATAAAARYCNATPVLAEVLVPHDLGLDPEDVARRITPRTKAVCAVHYAGYAAPVARLGELCREHRLVLIEDAAHSPGGHPAPPRTRPSDGTGPVAASIRNATVAASASTSAGDSRRSVSTGQAAAAVATFAPSARCAFC